MINYLTLLLLLNVAAHSINADKNINKNVRVQIRNYEGIKSSGELIRKRVLDIFNHISHKRIPVQQKPEKITGISFLNKTIMNCHQCKFVGTVLGSAHSSCKVISGFKDSELARLILSTGIASLTYKDPQGEEKPCVELDPHGVRNGWAMWPVNFDPCWINKCIFFTKEESGSTNS